MFGRRFLSAWQWSDLRWLVVGREVLQSEGDKSFPGCRAQRWEWRARVRSGAGQRLCLGYLNWEVACPRAKGREVGVSCGPYGHHLSRVALGEAPGDSVGCLHPKGRTGFLLRCHRYPVLLLPPLQSFPSRCGSV